MTPMESRIAGVCLECRAPAELRRIDDTADRTWRAVWWCMGCGCAAHGGNSYITKSAAEVAELPIARREAADPRQGSLFR